MRRLLQKHSVSVFPSRAPMIGRSTLKQLLGKTNGACQTVCKQQAGNGQENTAQEANETKSDSCAQLLRLSTDFMGIFDISIFASVRLGFPCKIQIYNNLLLYIHNKTPNALLFNSGAKLLCSVKCVRKPDAQTQFFSLLWLRNLSGLRLWFFRR